MIWDLSQQEFDAVVVLPAPKRYEHFVKRCADWEEVWGLRDEGGWVTTADDEGRAHFPVWPHPAYAAACAEGDWAGAEPEAIPLNEWRTAWLPGMKADDLPVTVFPVPGSLLGVAVSPARLDDDLQRELDEQYG